MANILEEFWEDEEEQDYHYADDPLMEELEELEDDLQDDLEEDYELGLGGEDLIEAGDDLLDHDEGDEDVNEFEEILNQTTQWDRPGGGAQSNLEDLKNQGFGTSLEDLEEDVNSHLGHESLLVGARNRSRVLDEEVVDDVLKDSSNSYIVADSLDVRGALGRGSNGSVLAAKGLDVPDNRLGGVETSLSVITGPGSEHVGSTFSGDWERLQAFLDRTVPEGRFDFNLHFDLKESIASVDVLKKDLEVINQIDRMASEDQHSLGYTSYYSAFRGNEEEFYPLIERDDFREILANAPVFSSVVDLEMPEFVADLDNRGRDVAEEAGLVESLKSNFSYSPAKDRKAEEIYSDNRELLYEIQDRYEASSFVIGGLPIVETDMGVEPEKFLQEFEGGSEARTLEADFSSTDVAGGQYEQAVEKLESLARIEGNYETEIDYDSLVKAVLGPQIASEIDIEGALEASENEDSVESALLGQELGELIGKKMREDPEEAEKLIQKRDELKSRLSDKKRQEAFEQVIEEEIEYPELRQKAYREINRSEDPELDFLDHEQVNGMLGALADQHLAENSSAYHDAKRLSDLSDGREVSFEIYDKSLQEIPYKEDRSLPCTFPGSNHNPEFFLNYMMDPGTQVGKIETEKGEGVALMKLVEDEGDEFLYVHSVEADRGDNIASDREIAETIQGQLEDYAQELAEGSYRISDDGQERDIELDGILYSMETHNNGTPGNFQRALREDDGFETDTRELDQVGLEHDAFDHDLGAGVSVYEKAL